MKCPDDADGFPCVSPGDGEDARTRRRPADRGETDDPPFTFVYDPPEATISARVATRLPVDADAPENRRPATELSTLIDSLMERLAPRGPAWLSDAVEHWADWVGADVAASSRPGKFANGTLYVYVKGSVRLAELKRHHLQAIDSRVRAKAGKAVRSVRLTIDPGD
jgi:predicted nucleic acid-binding Zn ribbon protein